MENYPREDIFTPRFVKVWDPILDNKSKKIFPVIKGGVETTEREYSTTTYSNSSVTFNVIPPNQTTFVSRRFLLKCPVTVTINPSVSNTVENLWQAGYIAFRQFPLHSVIKSIEIAINGQSTTLNINDFIKPLLLYHNNARDLNERNFSMTPALRDQSNAYDMLAPFSGTPAILNPLNQIGDSIFDNHARGSFPVEVTPGTAQTATVVTATLCEELLVSPLLFGGVEDQGFIGIQKIDINITWDSSLLERMISQTDYTVDDPASTYGVERIDVDIGQPSLLFRYVTPPIDMPIPRYIQYNYNQIQRYPKDFAEVTDADDHQYVSDNIQLNAIPRFLYIYLRDTNATRDFKTADSYMAIKKIQINWNNSNALLANATQFQLYDICRKNGVDLNWAEWSGLNMPYVPKVGDPIDVTGLGSVLCLEFGTDIGLREDECPGLIGTYNLQITITAANVRGENMTPALYMVTIIPGVFTIYDNSASKRIGVISRNEVLRSATDNQLDYYDLQKNLMSGGGTLKKFKKWYKKKGRKILGKVGKGAKTAFPELAPGIDTALKVSDMIIKPKGSGGVMMGAKGYHHKRKSRTRKKSSGGRKRKVGRPKKKRGGMSKSHKKPGRKRKVGRPKKKR